MEFDNKNTPYGAVLSLGGKRASESTKIRYLSTSTCTEQDDGDLICFLIPYPLNYQLKFSTTLRCVSLPRIIYIRLICDQTFSNILMFKYSFHSQ